MGFDGFWAKNKNDQEGDRYNNKSENIIKVKNNKGNKNGSLIEVFLVIAAFPCDEVYQQSCNDYRQCYQ